MSEQPAVPVLELVDVRKSFGDELVLQGVSLTVPEHSVTVLIGASGSGKSTLLRCVNQLERVDDGLILFDGEDICDPRVDHDDVRKRIGIVFQAFNLFPHMRVIDNITLALRKVHGVGTLRCSPGSRWPTRLGGTPTASPAASSSAWRSCAPSPCRRGSCSSTRSPRPSTPCWSTRSSPPCASCARRA
jgi:ABC-type dipeptide/oligopeptide/nickel transport system ATPase component